MSFSCKLHLENQTKAFLKRFLQFSNFPQHFKCEWQVAAAITYKILVELLSYWSVGQLNPSNIKTRLEISYIIADTWVASSWDRVEWKPLFISISMACTLQSCAKTLLPQFELFFQRRHKFAHRQKINSQLIRLTNKHCIIHNASQPRTRIYMLLKIINFNYRLFVVCYATLFKN